MGPVADDSELSTRGCEKPSSTGDEPASHLVMLGGSLKEVQELLGRAPEPKLLLVLGQTRRSWSSSCAAL